MVFSRADTRFIGPSLEEDEARAILTANPDPVELGPVDHIAATVTDLRRSEPWSIRAPGLVTPRRRHQRGRHRPRCLAGLEPRMAAYAGSRGHLGSGAGGGHLPRSPDARRMARPTR